MKQRDMTVRAAVSESRGVGAASARAPPRLRPNGIQSFEKCFKEASTFCDSPSEHEWSHPLVYHAGLKTGWFFLKNESEQIALKEFKNKFDSLIEDWLEGKQFASPDVPRLEENVTELDKTQQLSFIKKLKKNY